MRIYDEYVTFLVPPNHNAQPEIDALVVSEEISAVKTAVFIRRLKQLARVFAYLNPYAQVRRRHLSMSAHVTMQECI